jgi:hypothetical protein
MYALLSRKKQELPERNALNDTFFRASGGTFGKILARRAAKNVFFAYTTAEVYRINKIKRREKCGRSYYAAAARRGM